MKGIEIREWTGLKGRLLVIGHLAAALAKKTTTLWCSIGERCVIVVPLPRERQEMTLWQPFVRLLFKSHELQTSDLQTCHVIAHAAMSGMNYKPCVIISAIQQWPVLHVQITLSARILTAQLLHICMCGGTCNSLCGFELCRRHFLSTNLNQAVGASFPFHTIFFVPTVSRCIECQRTLRSGCLRAFKFAQVSRFKIGEVRGLWQMEPRLSSVLVIVYRCVIFCLVAPDPQIFRAYRQSSPGSRMGLSNSWRPDAMRCHGTWWFFIDSPLCKSKHPKLRGACDKWIQTAIISLARLLWPVAGHQMSTCGQTWLKRCWGT